MLHFASQADADAYVLTHELSQLQSSPRKSKPDRARILRLRGQLNALKSPLYRLPDDLLAAVFELGQPLEPPGRFVQRFSLVGKRFRNVALATPALWSDITVRLPLPRTRRRAQTELKLERSRAHDIALTVEVLGAPDLDEQIGEFQEFVRPLFARSKRLEVVAWAQLPFLEFFPAFAEPSTKLLSLTLRLGSAVAAAELARLVALLRACQALEHLETERMCFASYPPTGEGVPVELPLLRSLSLRETNFRRMALGVASLIRAPKLESLAFRWIMDTERTSHFIFLSPGPPDQVVVPPSAVPAYVYGVRHLILHEEYRAKYDTIPHVKQMHELTRLEVKGLADFSPLLKALETTAPKLTELTMEKCNLSASASDPSDLLDLIRVRNGSNRDPTSSAAPLTAVRLVDCPGGSEYAFKKLAYVGLVTIVKTKTDADLREDGP